MTIKSIPQALGPVLATLLTAALSAQTPAASVDTLYADAMAGEKAVRTALAEADAPTTLLKAVRTVVADFENVVRRYPSSGYCDDALWHAGRLAISAFEKFGDARERTTATRLLQDLTVRYPSSKFVKQVPQQLAALEATPQKSPAAGTDPASPVGAPVPAASPGDRAGAVRPVAETTGTPATTQTDSPGPAAAATRLATIKAIRRVVLPDAVRVVIELDSEVTFHDERLADPPRVFVDLPSTRIAPTLVDKTIRFEGTDDDIVRQVRVGRHPGRLTRVVLDTGGVSSYSVYPLYSPFRLVIDCLRDVAKPATAAVSPPGSRESGPLAAAGSGRAPEPAAAGRLPAPVATTIRIRTVLPIWTASLPVASPLSSDLLTEAAAPAPDVRSTAPESTAAALKPPGGPSLPVPIPTPPTPNPGAAAPVPVGPSTTGSLPASPLPPPSAPNSPAPTSTSASTGAAPAHPPSLVSPDSASRNLAGGYSLARQLGLSVSRIVIDPGHGGHDPGAKGSGITEAELVLDVALRLETLLSQVAGTEVVLTRRTDEFVSLQERTAIANRETADLFLSIHANANSSLQVSGIETYFLNFANNLSAAAVAARENAASGQAMSALPDVVKAIALHNKLDESRDFATIVQRAMVTKLQATNKVAKDLGVKQAPFVVLIGASMPSVLTEISFVTNPQENKLLKRSAYRQRIAEALFDAIRKYQTALKHGTAAAQ